MNPQFGWISATRSEAVEARLRRLLREWLVDWSVHAPESVDIEPTEELTPFSGLGLALHSERDEEMLRIALAQMDLDRFGAWLAGLPEAPCALAAEVGGSAWRDLMERIASCMLGQVVTVETAEDSWPRTSTHVQLGALLFAVRLGDFRLPVAVARMGVDRLAPPENRARTRPANWASRIEVLENNSLTTEAVLSMGRISLREIAHLSPGEVLVGECSVGSKAMLRIKGSSQVLASGMLVRKGKLRAITLTSESSKQESP